MKKIFIIFLFMIFLAAQVLAAVEKKSIQDLNYNKDVKIIIGFIEIDLQPFDELRNSYVFINDCAPEKIVSRNQKIEFLRMPEQGYIKIDIVSSNPKYKSKIIYLKEGQFKTEIKLREKITPELSEYINTLTKTIIYMAEYRKNISEPLRQKIDANLKILFNIDKMNYIQKKIRMIDYDEYFRIIEQVNFVAFENIEDEYYKLMAHILMNLIPKINQTTNDYIMLKTFKQFENKEKVENVIKLKNKNMFINLITAAPLLKSVYEWFKYLPQLELDYQE